MTDQDLLEISSDLLRKQDQQTEILHQHGVLIKENNEKLTQLIDVTVAQFECQHIQAENQQNFYERMLSFQKRQEVFNEQQLTIAKDQTGLNERQERFNEQQLAIAKYQTGFNERQEKFNEQQLVIAKDQTGFNERQQTFNERQQTFNERFLDKLDEISKKL